MDRSSVSQPSSHFDADEVHVWWIDLGDGDDILRRRALLSDDETRRADRFHSTRDRDRFIAGRAAMRTILAGYVGKLPDRLIIETSSLGKPRLGGEPPLQFNLSHSGNLALLAVAVDRSVGIDVEEMRTIGDLSEIVERFFSMAEREAFEAVPIESRTDLFFRMWTRKEAYLKALGVGLSESLEGIDVGTETAPIILAGGERGWTIVDLECGLAHRSALAVEGEGCEVRRHEYGGRSYS